MALQLDILIRNAILDAIEVNVGTAPIIRFYNGSAPANVAAALSGNTLLAEGTLPSDWLAAASSASKAKAGTWTATGQSGAGAGSTTTFWRIYASDGTTAKVQGSATVTGGGGDITLDNASIANAQVLTFASFSLAAANA